MNATQVISVNPGNKTIGELLQEASKYEPVQSIVNTSTKKSKRNNILNALTGISSKTSASTSRRMLFLRVITSAILGGLAWYSWYSGQEPILFLPLIVLGASLLTGFMTRIVSIGMMAACIYFAMTGMAGAVISGALAFTALVFAILGPAKFSLDQCIRLACIRHSGRKRPHNVQLDYRSYTRL